MIQNKINEPELRTDFCIKWYYWKEPSPTFSEIPWFTARSSWKPWSHPNLEVFFSQIQHEICKTCEKPLCYSDILRYEWGSVCSLADDLYQLVIKEAEKGWCVIAWSHNDYVMEVGKQLNDTKVHNNMSDSILKI